MAVFYCERDGKVKVKLKVKLKRMISLLGGCPGRKRLNPTLISMTVALAMGIIAGQLSAQTTSPKAQLSSPVTSFANSTPWEFGGLVQGGVGLEQRTNYNFILFGGHLGRVLTPQFGSGFLRGNFEYAVEFFPFWQAHTPTFQRLMCSAPNTGCSAPYTVGGTYTGMSFTPAIFRWNFTRGHRLMPWVQAAGGVLWTDHKFPAVGDLNPADPTQTGPNADTSVWNFTPQGGVGFHYFLKPAQSLDFSINGVHISSASLGDKNPGVNVSLQMSLGYTWWK